MGYDFFESVDVYKKSADNDLTQTKQKYFKAPQDTFSIKYAHSNSQFIPQGIPSKGWISSYFGSRTDPVFEGTAFHRGIDIAQLQGKPVWATADGKVTFAGKKRYFGNVVEVDHPESGYKTIYAHLQTINVRTGYAVTRGQRVGSVGSTGKSTGPHLHYEVHFQNRAVDPLEFMFDPDVMP
ncbi:MAG: M23 family metallopeptidase [Chitinispirillales bacterium]|nr:M23 family metallopeptidase [Chitinispirillales bacterium]